jgi:carbamoyltransferase
MGATSAGSSQHHCGPGQPQIKDIVNAKIKFREPFDPSVLAEQTENYFELPHATCHYPARYTLYVVPVKPEKRSALPAITHVDGTGRLQTVCREQSPRYYSLIERFGQATGIPVLLNTSFNLIGEPIVTTPTNAFHTYSASEMDTLVPGNFIRNQAYRAAPACQARRRRRI